MNSSKIRLSITTACNARSPFFFDMLSSVLESGYHFRNTEFVIGDNASPLDGDGKTARDFAARYPDIVRVFRNEVNNGVGGITQNNFENARGEYVMTFGYDDIFVPFDIDRNLDFLDAHPEFAGVTGKKRLFNSEVGDMQQSHGGDYSVFATTLDARINDCGMIWRASDVRESGGCFPKNLPGMPDFMPDVVNAAGIAVKKVFYFDNQLHGFYRKHPNQHTALMGDRYAQGYMQMRKSFIAAYPELWDALYNGKRFVVTPELRFPAMILLGIIAGGMENLPIEKRLAACDVAEQIMPGDYAVQEYRIKYLFQLGRYREVLDECLKMFALDRGVYTRLVIMEWTIRAAEKLNMPTQLFQMARQNEQREFFDLTPAQRELFEHTIARARELK
ncbi:MAG: glycosyltransferase [Victivallaceae bacterium]|nr:glycosyltransferase [Victivallaceae bacterium]